MDVNIALLAGDGIGPEVMREALRVLDAAASKFGFTVERTEELVGGAAIDACGTPLPEKTIAACDAAEAILFGSVGGPKWDTTDPSKPRPEQGLLAIRKGLGLYANLRPVVIFNALADASTLKPSVIDGVDCVIVRELTGGLYFGERERTYDVAGAGVNGAPGQQAYDTLMYSEYEIERIVRHAFETARKRRGRVHSIDKANVLETSRLWREVAQDMAPRYPEVELEFMFVDNAAMQIVRQPTHFDVIVTENMFGDILTDEASVISGSLGMLPSASVGSEVALFEPIHGSYPQAAGKNIANPMATILSAAMLLEHLGLDTEGSAVRAAVDRALTEGVVTEDLAAQGERRYSTSEVGDFIAAHI